MTLFYGTFQSLIHNDTSLSDIQKFHYLISSLQGDAADVIDSLDTSAQNYTTAWTILRESLRIKEHVSALFNLPQVERESVTCLRQLLNHLKHL
ncbi:hypothetical protein PR048_030292 [Dryococelus australis]|uniref:Uncharacterized protein n=1 Tax=Dryococelus australis TaxID=614101 RepID=A0ABQ9GBB2_9NEOP|nr:hypothetical protein PR048_030292 [Dryococelus australis]